MPTSDLLRKVQTYPIVREDELRRVLRGFTPAEMEQLRAAMNPYPVSADEAKRHAYTHVVVQDYWTEVQVDNGWVAAFRITPQDGEPVVSELRIYPLEQDAMGPGRWRAELLGCRAPVPRGGLSARVVHQARVGAALHAARAQLSRLPRAPHLFGPGGQYDAFTPADARAALTRVGPGRKGHGVLFFAELAKAYTERLDVGDMRPIATLARARKVTPARIRDMIHRARLLGLLTPALKQGQRGGTLTAKARAILKVGRGSQRTAKGRRKPR
jgi:hypothetical protein